MFPSSSWERTPTLMGTTSITWNNGAVVADTGTGTADRPSPESPASGVGNVSDARTVIGLTPRI